MNSEDIFKLPLYLQALWYQAVIECNDTLFEFIILHASLFEDNKIEINNQLITFERYAAGQFSDVFIVGNTAYIYTNDTAKKALYNTPKHKNLPEIRLIHQCEYYTIYSMPKYTTLDNATNAPKDALLLANIQELKPKERTKAILELELDPEIKTAIISLIESVKKLTSRFFLEFQNFNLAVDGDNLILLDILVV